MTYALFTVAYLAIGAVIIFIGIYWIAGYQQVSRDPPDRGKVMVAILLWPPLLIGWAAIELFFLYDRAVLAIFEAGRAARERSNERRRAERERQQQDDNHHVY